MDQTVIVARDIATRLSLQIHNSYLESIGIRDPRVIEQGSHDSYERKLLDRHLSEQSFLHAFEKM